MKRIIAVDHRLDGCGSGHRSTRLSSLFGANNQVICIAASVYGLPYSKVDNPLSSKGAWENFAVLITGAIIILIGILLLTTVIVNVEALAQSTSIFYVLSAILLIVGILVVVAARFR